MKEDNTNKFQPTWQKEPTFNDLNNDVTGSSAAQEELRGSLEKYKTLKAGGKKPRVKPGKSDMLPKMVRKHQEWKYPAMEEPFLNTPNMFQILGRSAHDTKAATQNSILLNYQYDTLLDKVALVNNVVRVFVDEGRVVTKTGWEAQYETRLVEKERPTYANAEESVMLMQQAVEQGQMSPEEAQQMLAEGQPMQNGTEMYEAEEEVLVKNQPTHEVLDNANVGIDPKCGGDINKATFVWHEYDTSYAELIKNKYEELEDGTTRGYYRNIDEAITSDSEVAYDINKPVAYSDFVHTDRARKKVKAVEYWGYWDIQGDGKLVAIVAEWVNDVLVRLEENPYPHGKLPFSVAYYMPVLNSAMGEPDAELLADNQDSNGKMIRAMHDIAGTAAVGQEFIDAAFFSSNADKNQYEKGNTVYYNSGMDPKRSIHRRSVDNIDPAVFQVMQANTAEAENLSGTKPFSGMDGAQGLGLAKMSLDATAKRELSVLRRLSALFVDMAKMVVSMNQAYMDEEQVVRITDSEYVTISRDELAGEFDLRISISTPEKDAQQASELMTLLQTNAASMDPKLYNLAMGKILRLQYHPDLAEEFETFEPQPDPVQLEIQQMQLENARLDNEKLKMEMVEIQSRVTERATRGTENITADIENKLAQAELRAAQAELALALAEKAKAEADKIDQDFLDVDSGAKREREVADQEYKAEVNHHARMVDANNRNGGTK